MQALDFGFERLKVTVIGEHVVSVAKAIFAAGLYLENGVYLFFAGVVAFERALNLQRLWHVDHQHALSRCVLPGLDQ